jgi:UPF0716 protein FxsA
MKLLSKLIPLFIIIPLVELAVLIQIGKWLGVWDTIWLCIITAILGAFLVKLEGLRVWLKLQVELMQGRMPTNQLIDGVLILVGGIMLLTPGVITDLIGLTLLLPFTRSLYRTWLKRKFEKKIQYVGQNYYQDKRKKAEVNVIENCELRSKE